MRMELKYVIKQSMISENLNVNTEHYQKEIQIYTRKIRSLNKKKGTFKFWAC